MRHRATGINYKRQHIPIVKSEDTLSGIPAAQSYSLAGCSPAEPASA